LLMLTLSAEAFRHSAANSFMRDKSWVSIIALILPAQAEKL
jgi:hypothetical protein